MRYLLTIVCFCLCSALHAQGFINATIDEVMNSHPDAHLKLIDYNADDQLIKTSDDESTSFFFIDNNTGRCHYTIFIPKYDYITQALIESANANYKVIVKDKKWTNSRHGVDVKITTYFDNNFGSIVFVYKDITKKDDE